MSAIKTNPKLWSTIVQRVKRENIGGTSPGQWSARKAQIAVRRYKNAGGRQKGPKSNANHLVQWSRQKWRTSSGRPSHITGERQLPSKAFAHLSKRELNEVNRSKRAAMKRHQQFSRMPRSISRKIRKQRSS